MNTPTIRHEAMSDIFHKFYVENFSSKQNIVFHRFDEPEPLNADAHDHPFDFRTTIIEGSYIERIWRQNPNGGTWWHTDIHRQSGSTHFVEAKTIHQIIDLPEGPCITMITHKEPTRKSGFWKFQDGKAMFREWDQEEFQPVNNPYEK